VTKRFLALTAAFLLTGCALDKQSAPALTGPSELGLSLEVKATPDIITQDGQSQSFIEVTARDATSQPAKGVTLRVSTAVNGTVADFETGVFAGSRFLVGGQYAFDNQLLGENQFLRRNTGTLFGTLQVVTAVHA
jgi:hypothetical protein